MILPKAGWPELYQFSFFMFKKNVCFVLSVVNVEYIKYSADIYKKKQSIETNEIIG